MTLLVSLCAYADKECEAHLEAGARFLHQRDSNLHTRPRVQNAGRRARLTSQRPTDKIMAWLQELDSTSRKISARGKLFGSRLAWRYTTPQSEIPESFFQNQVRIARERGHGDVEMTPERRRLLANAVSRDQRNSLLNWIVYFQSDDANVYPMWIKYWAFTGLVKLGLFNPADGTFGNRSKGQVAPFPELNREAFGMVVNEITNHANGTATLDETSFGKLYGRALFSIRQVRLQNLSSVNGEWRHFERGSSPQTLAGTLQGQGTGWCTAGESTAEAQLSAGAFDIFYSRDIHGAATVPRIAIRWEGDSIAEVRGVGLDQNLDAKISTTDVLQKKLQSLGDKGHKYLIRFRHMQRLTKIEKAVLAKRNLSPADLRFLYELDEKIEGFGYSRDPRIEDIIKMRNPRRDIAIALGIPIDAVSVTAEQAIAGSQYHYGDLEIGLKGSNVYDGILVTADEFQRIRFPKTVSGDFTLNGITRLNGIKLPEKVGGDFDANKVLSAEGTVFPKDIGGDFNMHVYFRGETNTWPKQIGGDLNLMAYDPSEEVAEALGQATRGDLNYHDSRFSDDDEEDWGHGRRPEFIDDFDDDD